MSVTEAEEFFGAGEAHVPAAHAVLDRLAQVGLGYLRIGQPLTTLSGGERQRLKLATHMAEQGGVYVLDEPTTGLHLADVEQLLGLLDRLVDAGKSVIVVEHHQGGHGPRRLDRRPRSRRRPRRRPRSSSRAPRPTSWPTAPPSPASTSRPTSAPEVPCGHGSGRRRGRGQGPRRGGDRPGHGLRSRWPPARHRRGRALADARHVAVEFLHPVIVGKRALPAAVGVRRGGPHDIVMAIGYGGSTVDRAGRHRPRRPRRARAPATSSTLPAGDAFAAKEAALVAYHVLWELVHVFLDDARRRRRRDRRPSTPCTRCCRPGPPARRRRRRRRSRRPTQKLRRDGRRSEPRRWPPTTTAIAAAAPAGRRRRDRVHVRQRRQRDRCRRPGAARSAPRAGPSATTWPP